MLEVQVGMTILVLEYKLHIGITLPVPLTLRHRQLPPMKHYLRTLAPGCEPRQDGSSPAVCEGERLRLT